MTVDRGKIRWNGWGWSGLENPLAGRDDVWAWLASELGMPTLLATPARPLAELALPASRLTAAQGEKLVFFAGEKNVRSDVFDRASHARGKSYYDLLRLRAGTLNNVPDAVVYPGRAQDVLDLLSFASLEGIAVVPFGGGSSVVGGVTAASGPFDRVIALDMTRMNRLLSVDTVSRTAEAEAGIFGPDLETALAAHGMTLGHYPQSFEFSTLGGWIAHRGSGQQSGLYGRSEDWFISADVATPRGLLKGDDYPASAAGPRIADLLVGSEGVFGIITSARVRVKPKPKLRDYSGYLFADFASGAAAIREAKQSGVAAAMLRLSDSEETRFFRAFAAIGKPRRWKARAQEMVLRARGMGGEPCLLVAGFAGEPMLVADAHRHFSAIASRHGALPLGEHQGKRWYKGRFHGPYLRDQMLDRGVGVDTLETAASWPKLDNLYRAVRKAVSDSISETVPRPGARGAVLCHISHAYADGASLYFTLIFPRALDDEIGQWRRVKRAASDAIADHGGTISHHHGIGEDHLPWMAAEKGELGVEILRAIKRTLDPSGILNPGKLIP